MSSHKPLQFETVDCPACGRQNHPSAGRCLWCCIPIIRATGKGPDATTEFASTVVELDYLDGIERLDNPVTTRVHISTAGVEVEEILPGTRRHLIAVDALIAADITDATVVIRKEKKRSLWEWLQMGSKLRREAEGQPEIQYDTILTIRYRAGDESKTAVFHREDRLGKTYVANVANLLNALIAFRNRNS